MAQKIFVTVKTRCTKPFIEKIDGTHFKIGVNEPPVKGKANMAVVAALANYLNLPKGLLSVKSGKKTKNKVLEIK